MPENLKARLGRIRSGAHNSSRNTAAPDCNISGGVLSRDALWTGWTEIGFKTLKRELHRELPFLLPSGFPEALAVLVQDFARLRQRIGRIPSAGELLFFDLETTGLSGGAGTVAFLAAFGRFIAPSKNGKAQISVTQYLLLDYSGESDFIEKVSAEFISKELPSGDRALPIAVSFNGKCFDSQILRNRCLMNGIKEPEYFHADLLHPARRLWKRMLSDCSQATIEVKVLGLDRVGDISGALAPDIWFSFLRNGENLELLRVCDHNLKDITGLASLFLSIVEIAANPLGCLGKYKFDLENLALAWRAALKRNESLERCEETGKLLLKTAAGKGFPRAAIAAAIEAEWRLKDPVLALSYAESALTGTSELSENLRQDLEKRRSRLKEKIKSNARANKK